MRIDVYLAQRGLAESRQKAKGMLEAGIVSVNGKPVTKSSFDVCENDNVIVSGAALRYVGRGGLKLEGALQAFSFDPTGMTAVDIGASTGGFTDCLLQNGAKKVYAVDSGTDQLHSKLKEDLRVVNMEKCNARNLTSTLFSESIELAVMDLSFISQTCIYPALARILQEGATVISLIKPQFEAGKNAVGKNGIVKDKKTHILVIEQIIKSAQEYNLYCKALSVSPITGGDGNIEYLALFTYAHDTKGFEIPNQKEIYKVVFGANQ